LTVESTGKIERLERKVYRILRPQGSAKGVVHLDFDAQSRITHMQGWSLATDGKVREVSDRDAADTALPGIMNGELESDLRARLLHIPAAEPGSLIAYETQQELRPYVLTDDWSFQETVPVREAHYSLQLPPGWQYKATWIHHDEESPTAAGNSRRQWIVRDVKGIRTERRMPSFDAVAARLTIALLPPSGKGQGFQNWNEFGSWYQTLTQGRRDASPDIKQKVLELTTSATTTLGKEQALAGFVQSDIRYVAIELGIGGLQPHPAKDVFSHRYGDCKDKATLLSSMLKEIGVDSYYVMVNTQRGAIDESTPANPAFDHAILAIQLPPELNDPSLLAVINDPKLARLLLFDPTDSYTPLGQLSGTLQNGFGLLVAPDGGQLIKLPQMPPSTNSIQRTAHLQLDEAGNLQGEVHELRTGDEAAFERSTVVGATEATDQIKSVESVMADSFPTFQLTHASIGNLHASNRPLEWNYTLEVPHYAKLSGGLLTVRPRVIGSKSTGLLETREPRRYDIDFDGPQRDTDTFEINLPEGYGVDELPPPVNEEHAFGSYHSKTELSGHILKYTRTYEIKNVTVPAAQADELKKFFREIASDERMVAVLKKNGQ
ncbi:MAG TPA: DUF3857 and transglutaminase domain-containing protein, partial [Steroidobacteraceae bacterium]|nr:DUF3857 and transglutaminase domain-containing protein [Steroidobacteraceae bacterium]